MYTLVRLNGDIFLMIIDKFMSTCFLLFENYFYVRKILDEIPHTTVD